MIGNVVVSQSVELSPAVIGATRRSVTVQQQQTTAATRLPNCTVHTHTQRNPTVSHSDAVLETVLVSRRLEDKR